MPRSALQASYLYVLFRLILYKSLDAKKLTEVDVRHVEQDVNGIRNEALP